MLNGTVKPMARGAALEEMRRSPLDMLVVGGGIVGSGVARDAAMRGLRAGLVDRYDFAFGTSSRSSRLLHGGLRYLAQGRIGLVREASVEKVVIHRIAPHLAKPLPFIFPTRRGTPWKLWKLRIGVKVYDLLCGGRNLGKSSGMGAREALGLLPQLNEEDLTGAVRYYDGLTNDARLVLDTLRSAAAHGALLANYAAMEKSESGEGGWRCIIRDHLSGETFTVAARCVVNATGAWADGFAQSEVALRLTKGVHLVVDRSKLHTPPEEAVVMAEGTRILFVIPWGSERLILGTTDTDYSGPVEAPQVEESDVRYILDVANRTFPSAGLTREDVISAYVGLRPLIADPNGKPSDVSRAHQIRSPQAGWIDVAGGKLTTYRLMAEQTVDLALKQLGRAAAACATGESPLLEEKQAGYSGILPPAVSRQAVEHYCRGEWAVHLDDVMIRRTSWRWYHRDHLAIAREVAGWMAECLGWDQATCQDEIRRYEQITSEKMEASSARHLSQMSHGSPAAVAAAASVR